MTSNTRRARTVRRNQDPQPGMPVPQLHDQVRTAAYFKAEARGFSPGRELDDWLEAERDFAVARG